MPVLRAPCLRSKYDSSTAVAEYVRVCSGRVRVILLRFQPTLRTGSSASPGVGATANEKRDARPSPIARLLLAGPPSAGKDIFGIDDVVLPGRCFQDLLPVVYVRPAEELARNREGVLKPMTPEPKGVDTSKLESSIADHGWYKGSICLGGGG